MFSKDKQRSPRRGAALISALSMLLLLSMLGTAYVGYMSLEQKESRMSVQSTRARYLADGGVYAAIGEIQTAIRENRVPETEYTFELPLYMTSREGLVRQSQTVTVRVTDESALVNVNHVERAVLEALGVPRNAAREIRAYLAGPVEPDQPRRAWFANVQGLRTRGFLTGQSFQQSRIDLMTVYTAADANAPRNYININSAPPAVLAALFNLSEEESVAVAEQRPFRSWDDTVQKIGKDTSTYNVIENAEPNRAMPVELALSSRCFRLVASTTMQNAFTSRQGMYKGVEAVVLLTDDGDGFELRFWSETPAELTEILMASGTGDDEQAEETGEVSEYDSVDSESVDAEGAPAEGELSGEAPSESEDTSAAAVSNNDTE